jgi:hypothetical protein
VSWAEAAAELSLAVGDEFSRTVTLVPMTRPPNARPLPDPLRPPVETRAIFDDPMAQDRLNMEEVKVQTQTPYVSLMAEDLPYALVQGDHVLIDGARYEITNKRREIYGRAAYALVMVA